MNKLKKLLFATAIMLTLVVAISSVSPNRVKATGRIDLTECTGGDSTETYVDTTETTTETEMYDCGFYLRLDNSNTVVENGSNQYDSKLYTERMSGKVNVKPLFYNSISDEDEGHDTVIATIVEHPSEDELIKQINKISNGTFVGKKVGYHWYVLKETRSDGVSNLHMDGYIYEIADDTPDNPGDDIVVIPDPDPETEVPETETDIATEPDTEVDTEETETSEPNTEPKDTTESTETVEDATETIEPTESTESVTESTEVVDTIVGNTDVVVPTIDITPVIPYVPSTESGVVMPNVTTEINTETNTVKNETDTTDNVNVADSDDKNTKNKKPKRSSVRSVVKSEVNNIADNVKDVVTMVAHSAKTGEGYTNLIAFFIIVVAVLIIFTQIIIVINKEDDNKKNKDKDSK